MVQEGIDWNGSVLGLYNTCWWNTYSQEFAYNCGDDAEGYYEEFDYDDGMIIHTFIYIRDRGRGVI